MKSIIILLVSFSLLGGTLVAQPVNDEPCGAIELVTTSNCKPVFADLNLSTITSTVPLPGCAPITAGDVWFLVLVPPSGSVTITTYSGSITDAAISIYAADDCSQTFDLIACVDDIPAGQMPEVALEGQLVGTTIYVRVWGYGNTIGTLSICAVAPPEPPKGDCAYRLEMYDTFGDGWGQGARVDVFINGALLFSDSLLVGSYGQHVFGVAYGDELSVDYTPGAFNWENRIILIYFDGISPVYSSGELFVPGPAYSTTVDCLPAPPDPGDCAYALPLCGDTTLPQYAMQTGYIPELNTGNQGCLASGERLGIWTQFAIATAGTLGFILDPTFTEDIDFVIWGPLDSIVCPPIGGPIRCSYAATAGPTGLDTIATDVSEGTGGNRWVSALNVVAGERYMLYISAFSQIGGQVDLSWQLSNGASLACPLVPVADLSSSQTQILVGESVDFTDLSTNAPNAWNWVFEGGDPSASNLQDPMGVVYNNVGCFDVMLTAANTFGNASTSRICEINVDTNTGVVQHGAPRPFHIVQDANGVSVHSVFGGSMEVALLDALGKNVISSFGDDRVELSTSSCATGAYLLRMRTASHQVTQRIAIMR